MADIKMNGQISDFDRIKNAHWQKGLAWVFFQVLVPYAFVVACWPIAFLGNVDFAFEKTFFGADSLLVGAMLFIAIVVEIHIEKNQRKHLFYKRSLDLYWVLSFVFVIMFLVFFSAIKYKSMTFESTLKANHDYSDYKVHLAVIGCIWGGILAIVWSLIAGLHINLLIREAELAELEQVVSEQ